MSQPDDVEFEIVSLDGKIKVKGKNFAKVLKEYRKRLKTKK